ncbi:MAG: carboxylating nicotinate-nucleotide diphosphorylase [Candidatus Heimdallarchaeaceae archaeon]
MIPEVIIEEDIKRWIQEDINYWDITSSFLPDSDAKATIYAKQEGIIAGLYIAKKVFSVMGAKETKILIKEGERVKKKTAILTVKGNVKTLLQAERLALNLLGRLSGIASKTNRMLSIARELNPKIRICGTRKTVPGLSKYDKYAITIGGGDTHRFNLSAMVLLKENHLALFNSVKEAVEVAKAKVSFSQKIEVEVQNEEQAIEAVKSRADIIMLDNFSPVQAKLVIPKIKKINPDVLVELSGNIKEENLKMYSLEGVNLISSGALTHSVKNFDLTMLIEK